ncbi:MAG: hypothetical protein AAFY02_22335, partial [Pseudomonadota bacterium]
IGGVPAESAPTNRQEVGVMLAEIKNIASGAFEQRDDFLGAAADSFNSMTQISGWLLFVLVVALGALGVLYALSRLAPVFRARHAVERITMAFLVICATIAILTTLGIVLSLLFESLRFFGRVSFTEFLFGLQWSPQTAKEAQALEQKRQHDAKGGQDGDGRTDNQKGHGDPLDGMARPEDRG